MTLVEPGSDGATSHDDTTQGDRPTPQRDHPGRRHGRQSTRHDVGHVLRWTVLGSFVPGSGLLVAGHRRLGAALLSVTAVFAAVVLWFVLTASPVSELEALLGRPDAFVYLAVALVVLVLAWAAIVVGTHKALRRRADLTRRQRIGCGVLVVALVALVALPAATAVRYALIARQTITAIFADGTSRLTHRSAGGTGTTGSSGSAAVVDPWAEIPRVNVLLIGSDAGKDRTGIRPDTLILASVDTRSGDTVLFSLPRNLDRVPFPPGSKQAEAYPRGFTCINPRYGVNTDCLLNSFWTFGEDHWKEYYPQAPTAFDAGLQATEQAVEQVTGLTIDQYAMLDLRGFVEVVDAIGGITVNVRERLPIGGDVERPVASGWIEPGDNQHLDGYHALWYARSRWSTNDFSRMDRQRCVIGAVVREADPQRLALAFPGIAAAARDSITTDIPLQDVPAWVTLADRVKAGTVRSLPFTDQVIRTSNPDFPRIRQLVQDALVAPQVTPATSGATPSSGAGSPTGAASAGATPSSVPSPTATSSSSSSSSATPMSSAAAKQPQDVAQVC